MVGAWCFAELYGPDGVVRTGGMDVTPRPHTGLQDGQLAVHRRGTSSPGTVLATDVVTDLAVVQTERTGLPVLEYRIELPQKGETVLAIGSPLGLRAPVTAVIVSALNRQIPGSAAESRALVDLIQVDAAISPGDSGGALLTPRAG